MNNSFYKRFGLELTLEQAKQKFIIRVNENIFLILHKKLGQIKYDELIKELCKKLAIDSQSNHLRYKNYLTGGYSFKGIETLTAGDFSKTLQVLEKLYTLKDNFLSNIYLFDLEKLIIFCLNESINEDGIDLGINFINGKFIQKGDVLLDTNILKKSFDNMEGFIAKKYYNECIENYLKGNKKGVIEDCFETLEKLSQEILKNDKGLKENKKDLINYFKSNKIFTSYWVKIIETLYDYFNDHRHTRNDKTNENIDEIEVEATLYLTGLIINLVTKNNKLQ